MRLGFDVDGCLASFIPAYQQMFIDVTGEDKFFPGDNVNPPVWDWPQLRGYTAADIKAVWARINADPEFWFNLTPLSDIVILREYIYELIDDHEVYFITNRSGVLPKAQTEDWLRLYLDISPFAHPTVLITAKDRKGAVANALNLDAYIDDYHENAFDVARKSPSTRVFLIDKSYNQFDISLHWAASMPTAAEMADYWVKERVDRSRVTGIGEALRSLNLIPHNSVVTTP